MYDDMGKAKNDDVLNFELAGIGTRFVAILIDSIIVGMASRFFSFLPPAQEGASLWGRCFNLAITGISGLNMMVSRRASAS